MMQRKTLTPKSSLHSTHREKIAKLGSCRERIGPLGSPNVVRLGALALLSFTLAWRPEPLFSFPPPLAPYAESTQAGQRDGQHDFDFNIGSWHTHIRRVLDPLSGSANSIELNGTVTVRKIWGGRAQLEEIEADGPNGHFEGLTLFLYNPEAHQWSQSFIGSKTANLAAPLIGAFKDGRGELFAEDTFHDKSILVRGVWSNIQPTSHHFEESYSNDGGKTWSAAFIADLTCAEQPAGSGTPGAPPIDDATVGQHDFDFDLGTWNTHSSRLLHPLTGSTKWVELDGVTVVKKVWNGRASLAEYKANGAEGSVQLLALRWFNPATHEWSIDFATPKAGTLGNPGVGEFKNGRADFYDYEPINGKSVLVRFSIWRGSESTAQSEQAFSEDGGKTWEVNRITKYARAKDE